MLAEAKTSALAMQGMAEMFAKASLTAAGSLTIRIISAVVIGRKGGFLLRLDYINRPGTATRRSLGVSTPSKRPWKV